MRSSFDRLFRAGLGPLLPPAESGSPRRARVALARHALACAAWGCVAAAFVALVGVPTASAAQELPTLAPEDYGQWESLGTGTLSPDGRWLAARIERVDGESELRIHSTASDSLVTIPYGERPEFSDDGDWLAYAIGHSEEEEEGLRERDEPIRNRLGLLNLETGDTTTVSAVRSYAFSEVGPYLAMGGYPSEGSDGRGAPLIVRNLDTGLDTRLGDVAEYDWQDDGPLLAVVLDGPDLTGNGVQLYHPERSTLRTLASEEARFRRLTWRKDSDDLAVLRARGDEAHEDSTHVVMAWRDVEEGGAEAWTLDPAEGEEFPEGMRVV